MSTQERNEMAAPTRDRQRGQILLVFAAALVVVLLVGAVVLDLGFVFSMKRHQQDAADPGAVAAARFIHPTTSVSDMWTAACFYAVENDFDPVRTDTNALCPGAAPPGNSTLTVNYPPSQSGGEFAGKLGYVEVLINSDHKSFFAGIVGMGNIPVTSGAVAANDQITGGSSSLVALNATACGAGRVHGGGGAGGVYIFPATGVTDSGGYIQVNSACGTGDAKANNDTCTDSNNQGAFIANGGTTVVAPALYVQGACDMNGSAADFQVPGSPLPPGCSVDTCKVEEGANFVGDPLSLVRPPAPTDLTIRQCPGGGPTSTAISPRNCHLSGTRTLEPGTYYGGWRVTSSGASITLNPGIYVIAGGGISDTGGLLTSAAGRVLIFSTDASPAFKTACINGTASTPDGCQAEIRISGGAAINLTGLDRTSACPPYSATGCPFGGMLMWQDRDGSAKALANNGCDITIGGGGSLNLSGTIYAACGDVVINGNNSTSGCDSTATVMNCAAIQIVADTFDVGGAATLQMPYDPAAFYELPLKGLVR